MNATLWQRTKTINSSYRSNRTESLNQVLNRLTSNIPVTVEMNDLSSSHVALGDGQYILRRQSPSASSHSNANYDSMKPKAMVCTNAAGVILQNQTSMRRPGEDETSYIFLSSFSSSPSHDPNEHCEQ
ncbi:hypothetical protein ACLB2K_061553 [Fragaria x ananassa]